MAALALPAMDVADWQHQRQRHLACGFTQRIGVYQRKPPMGVVEAFLDLAGLKDRLPEGADFTVETVNTSLGELAVLTSLHVARFLVKGGVELPHNGRVAYARCLRRTRQDFEDRPFIGPTKDEREQIRVRYAEGNREIAKLLPEDEAELLLTESLH
jgi:hypothetical protein